MHSESESSSDTCIKLAIGCVSVVLGLAAPLLLSIALGQFGRIDDAMSLTTKLLEA